MTEIEFEFEFKFEFEFEHESCCEDYRILFYKYVKISSIISIKVQSFCNCNYLDVIMSYINLNFTYKLNNFFYILICILTLYRRLGHFFLCIANISKYPSRQFKALKNI